MSFRYQGKISRRYAPRNDIFKSHFELSPVTSNACEKSQRSLAALGTGISRRDAPRNDTMKGLMTKFKGLDSEPDRQPSLDGATRSGIVGVVASPLLHVEAVGSVFFIGDIFNPEEGA